ncbi:MAG: (d)CMP kinase [Hyphomicrobiales bacterium]|nr:(d)CMP kinase [Hyphomicrobiales bacterium]MDE2017749.1 (d)CMP kinase [Hyphomicrobiales bacterium]
MIVAIDGPAASGKGTISRRLAAALGVAHLDTGLLYRAVAAALVAAGAPLDNEAVAAAAARALDLDTLDPLKLRTREIGEAASVVAAHPAVREALAEAQRAFARRPGGAVLDGRDIGTVICPDADAKIYVVASPEVRAARRAKELAEADAAASFEDVLADIRRRDERDSLRTAAPLRQAPDAVLLDTSDLDVEGAVAAALAIVRTKRPA